MTTDERTQDPRHPFRAIGHRVGRLLAGKDSGISAGQGAAIIVALAILAQGVADGLTSLAEAGLTEVLLDRWAPVVAAALVLLIGFLVLLVTGWRVATRQRQPDALTPEDVVRLAAPVVASDRDTQVQAELLDPSAATDELASEDVAPCRITVATDGETWVWQPGADALPEQVVARTSLGMFDSSLIALQAKYPELTRERAPELHLLLPKEQRDAMGVRIEAYACWAAQHWPGEVHIHRCLDGSTEYQPTYDAVRGELARIIDEQSEDPRRSTDPRRIHLDVTSGTVEQRLACCFAGARANCMVGFVPSQQHQDTELRWTLMPFND